MRMARRQGERAGVDGGGCPTSQEKRGAQESTVPESVHDILNSPGQPLDAATRSFMEPRFGRDFSGVRVHTDSRAAESASAMEANAFTSNGNIVFGVNQYAPHTESGRRLLSHELTHVAQQEQAVPLKGGAGDAYEAQADAAADLIMSGKNASGLLEQGPEFPGPDRTGVGSRKENWNASRPIQMQGVRKNPPPQKPADDPKAELLHKSLERLLQKQELMEKVNGPAARTLAKAYLNRNRATGPSTLHATTYLDDRIPGDGQDPSEDEVSAAILGAMELSTALKAPAWKWTPPPDSEGETRNETVVEVFNWAADEVFDEAQGRLRDKAIEKVAASCATRWSAAQGLVVVAKMLVGGLEVYGWISLATSVLELLLLLQKPVARISRSEQIVADVKGWLQGLGPKKVYGEADFGKSLNMPMDKTIVRMR
jgi:hypothetical protein